LAADAAGEARSGPRWLRFDRSAKLAFLTSSIGSAGGLLLHRELDDAFGLTDRAAGLPADPRTGRNGHFQSKRAGALALAGLAAYMVLAGPAVADEAVTAQGTEPETGARLARSISLAFGFSTPDNFTGIITQPWDTSFEDTWIVSASASHLLWELDENTWLEGELGVGKRFGDSDAWEFFGLVFLRWDGLPWNEWVYTSIGVGIGPSYATEISETERRKSGNDQGSRTLNMLVPEIAFALPDDEATQLVFRLHHRSGVFGLFNGVTGGSTFVTVGVRVRF
jgi:hypothetical protein